jgi:hypothetical protein
MRCARADAKGASHGGCLSKAARILGRIVQAMVSSAPVSAKVVQRRVAIAVKA